MQRRQQQFGPSELVHRHLVHSVQGVAEHARDEALAEHGLRQPTATAAIASATASAIASTTTTAAAAAAASASSSSSAASSSSTSSLLQQRPGALQHRDHRLQQRAARMVTNPLIECSTRQQLLHGGGERFQAGLTAGGRLTAVQAYGSVQLCGGNELTHAG